jgi:uncharacterized protein with HEPN domain
MQKDDRVRLQHMFDAAKEAVSFIRNKTRGSLDKDRKLVLALVKAIEIIGEAAANVTKECREDLLDIPWTNIVGMRNRLIHAYFDINLDILWQTVTEDIKPLITELEKTLSKEKRP